MKLQSSVTELSDTVELPAPRPSGAGLAWGAAGILAFSLTLPLTRVAVDGGLDPAFVGSGRAVLAAFLAAILLLAARSPLPRGRQWLRIGVVAGGVVLGFPLLTSLALRTAEASHAALIVAVLPVTTAVLACLRTGERPRRRFWVAAGLGATGCVVFAALQAGGLGRLGAADLLLVAGVLCCAAGYAEGGLLARELGSWQTISWALVLAFPVMLALTLLSVGRAGVPNGTATAWVSFGYLGVVSMFVGFLAWYRGLALGPLLRVSQVQLLQPLLSVGWAVLLLGERVGWWTLLGAGLVFVCTAVAVRSR